MRREREREREREKITEKRNTQEANDTVPADQSVQNAGTDHQWTAGRRTMSIDVFRRIN